VIESDYPWALSVNQEIYVNEAVTRDMPPPSSRPIGNVLSANLCMEPGHGNPIYCITRHACNNRSTYDSRIDKCDTYTYTDER